MGAAMGTPFMPWQQLVADVGGEYDPITGKPFYREVQITVPRRGGKTQWVLSYELDRCLGWGRRQVGAYTAQDGFAAKKLLLTDQVPMLEASPLWKAVRRVKRSNGDEGIVFTNGSQIDVLPTTEAGGHGRTFDFAVADEAFADSDDRREQSLLPTMATKPDAQFVIVSTAGTQKSTWLRRKVEIGRQAAQEDTGSGIAYFEWSASEEDDPADPRTWWSCHPALGHTIDESVLAHARSTMEDGEFRRAYLNQWTDAEEQIIPAAAWDLVNFADVKPQGQLTFGIDVNEERSAAAIVAVSGGVVEVIDHRPTLGWVVDRVLELDARWKPQWAHDAAKSAPVASLLPALSGVNLTPVNDLPAACGALYDAVADQSVKFRRNASMDAAVAGAQRRPVGDGWAWARRGSVDTSPLVAATVALRIDAAPAIDPALNVW